ncbi:unnamed protein product [Didymodactylos carnosus]|uniref:Uncharacterized protein n=2 Tax=Didymodactylos carnosus TaxID=1234261 RepID=A0A8S2F451_9BILA|nr:unnamed protein product [Didymodactylos carnosus]CAF4197683.1 unnamed protein product [Didymodactylos carnosus]
MNDSLSDTYCPCCTILGKPQSRVNFLILSGLPESPISGQIKSKLTNSEKFNNNLEKLITYRNYSIASDMQNQLKKICNELTENDGASTTLSSPIASIVKVEGKKARTCCYGIRNLILPANQASYVQSQTNVQTGIYSYYSINAFLWDKLKEDILDELNPKPENEEEGNSSALNTRYLRC